MEVVPGDYQIHLYIEKDALTRDGKRELPHVWAMGPEIVRGAWKPNPEATFQRIMESSQEDADLARALECSMLEQ
jgi:hypothetical protein